MNAARFPAAPPRDKPPPSGNPRPAALDAPPPSRSSPPLLERFRSMLRDREDELRIPGDEEPPPLAAEDVVLLYEDVLSELTVNSKPVITELTIIAGEQREHAEGIADAICSRILEVPYEQKLPCLYLLDSIVKNIGSEYVRYFQVRLPEVFCGAYNQVPPNFHPAMRHLFGTWTPVFSSSVRRKIQSQLEFASPERQLSSGSGNIRNSESSSPRPGHGIHVNPKYLDARRQFDRPVNPQPWDRDPQVKPSIPDLGGGSSGRDTMERNAAEIPKKWPGASSNYRDVRKESETFTGLDSYEHKSLSQIGDHNLDQSDIVGQSVSTRGGLVQVGMDSGSSLANSKSNRPRHSSPKDSLGRLVERNSWQESDPQQTEAGISYDIASELSAMRSRELIDAYGNSKGKNAFSVKPPKIQKLEGNMLNSEVAVKDWQTSEEDEYVWEDMSPTLVDRDRSSRLMPRDTNFGNFGSGPRLEKPDSSILGAEFRRSNWSLHRQSLDPSTLPDEDRASSLGVGPGSIYRGSQTNLVPHRISQYSDEPWKSHYMHQQSSELNLSPRPEERKQLSFSAADVPSSNHRLPPDYPLKSDARLEKPCRSHSEPMNTDILPPVPSLITAEKVLTQGPTSAHIVPSTVWPSSHKLQQPAPVFVPSQSKQYMERLNNTGTGRLMMNRGVDMPFSAPWQPSETFDRRISRSALPATVLQNPSSVEKSSNQSGVPHIQLPPHQDPQGIQTARVAPPPPSQLPTQGQLTYHSVAYPSAFSLPHPSLQAPRLPQNPLQVHSGPLPPLPPGPPPTLLQSGTSGSSTSSMLSNAVPSGFSGLINSLMSQGLISLMPQPTSQDSLGFDFNPDQLKIRHEPAINDLYVNLPRQCTTCGLRLKCQEEHRSHMDWHVTKNRMSKNRKQKSSRKWFVSSKEWLSGAETLGVDAVPGFLQTETVVDKNEEKELAVPADEEQNLCALCGEPFEDFYSDEADEWMYKGAVYLNAPEGSVEGLDKFQLGPIVHAKCRSESTEVLGQA